MTVKHEYANFDLVFRRDVRGSYVAEVSGSPVGEGSTTFALPFSDQDLELFLLRIGQARSGMRRQGAVELEVARDFGRKLYEAAFGSRVGTLLERSLDEADRAGLGLRVRLHLAEVPELADLPWEFVYSDDLGRFLAASTQTPVVRYVDLARPIRPLTITPPLRVLVVIASPSDHPALDVEGEWRRLEVAFRDLVDRELVELTRAASGSLPSLQRHLRRGEYHVLHFVGHGGFDEARDDGVLAFENERGGSHLIGGEDLGLMLHDHPSLRLAVLNACEGARSSRTDPFGGTGKSLIRQGIPAVVAMQFEISDRAAVEFARQFYEAVADGYPVDAAMGEARKALYARGVEWGTPVLYMRSSDGRIFNVEGPGPQQRADQSDPDRVRRLLALAEDSMRAGDWVTAVSRLEDVVVLDPGNATAGDLLAAARTGERVDRMYDGARLLFDAGQWEAVVDRIDEIRLVVPSFDDPDRLEVQARESIEEAERRARLDGWYGEARSAFDECDWERAVERLERIAAESPDFEDAADLLVRASAHQQADVLLAEASHAVEEERWQAVLDRFAEMDELGDEHVVDPHGWRELATRRIEEQRLTRRLDTLYETALALVEADRWAEAERIVDRIERERPAYRGVDTFRDRIDAGLEEDRARERAAAAREDERRRGTESRLAPPGTDADDPVEGPVVDGADAQEGDDSGEGAPGNADGPVRDGRPDDDRSVVGTPRAEDQPPASTRDWRASPRVWVAGILAVLLTIVVVPQLVGGDEPSGSTGPTASDAGGDDGVTTPPVTDDAATMPPVIGDPPSDRVMALYYPGWGDMGSPDDWPWAFFPAHPVDDWGEPSQLAQHFAWLRQARVGVAMFIWQGRGSHSDDVVPVALHVAQHYGIEVAFGIDAYAGRSVTTLDDDVAYLYDQYGSHPAFHTTDEPTRWQQDSKPRGVFWIRDTALIASFGGDVVREVDDPRYWEPAVTAIHDLPEGGVVLADGVGPEWVEPVGFDGLIIDPLPDAAWVDDLPAGTWYVPVVRPGFEDGGQTPVVTIDRRGGETYAESWRAALEPGRPETVLVDSFNDWGVGTQIEPVAEGVVDDSGNAFSDYADVGAEYYLDTTTTWVDEFLRRHP